MSSSQDLMLLFGSVSEHFGGEGLDRRALLPCVRRQSSFAAGLFEKVYAIPIVFDRNLRQEQAAWSVHADQQTVAADLESSRLRSAAEATGC